GSSFVVELNGPTPGSGHDQIRLSAGVVSLGGSLSVQLGFEPAGQLFTIIDNTDASAVAGTFSGLPEGAFVVAGGEVFRISYQGGDGNDVVLAHQGSAAAGDFEWLRQFGTADPDGAWGIAVGASGVYVAGDTSGTFPGQASAGASDGFVRR